MYKVKFLSNYNYHCENILMPVQKVLAKLVFLCIYPPRYLLKGEREIKELCYEIKQIFFFSFIDKPNRDIKHLMCG